MKNLGIVVLLMALFATSAACAGTIDASNGGANWNVAPGADLNAFILLANSMGDPAKYGANLELKITEIIGSGILPTFGSIDMLASGAIFSGGFQYPTPASGIGTADVTRSVDLSGGTTTAEGLLANLVIHTTGVAPGVYTLAAIPSGGTWAGTHVIDGVNFEDIPMTFVSGTITVIPEPSTLVLGGIAALALLAFRCWGRRRVWSATPAAFFNR